MKKIINGKKYDTKTAKCVAWWGNGLSDRDFYHCNEGLFRKKTGEFFLYGEGGPMSKYSVAVGCNEWHGGEEIIPLTEQEAREWTEKYASEEYEEIFGEVEE